MTDIVERLRDGRTVLQYDSAGQLQRYTASPSPLDLEAADRIEALEAENSRLRSLTEWKAIREECAKVAETIQIVEGEPSDALVEMMQEDVVRTAEAAGRITARRIAAAIRALPPPPQQVASDGWPEFKPYARFSDMEQATELLIADVAVVWVLHGHDVELGYDMTTGMLVGVRIHTDVVRRKSPPPPQQ